MTINITELRRLAQAATPGPDGVSLSWIKLLQDFQQGANPAAINELLDRLEAAEKDVALKEEVIDALGSELNAVAKERDALRAKIEAMELQEPLITVLREPDYWSNGHFHKGTKPYISLKQLSKLKIGDNLYTLPGAKGE